MTTEKKKILEHFATLEQRLHKLTRGLLNPNEELNSNYPYWLTIEEVVKGALHSADLEDAQDCLNPYIEEIEGLLKEIPLVISKYTFVDDNSNVFTSSPPIIKASTLKKNFKKTITKELRYYLDELKAINNRIIQKLESLGTEKYSNAGFKMQLNLTGPEIGYFFYLLQEVGILSSKDKNGTVIINKCVF